MGYIQSVLSKKRDELEYRKGYIMSLLRQCMRATKVDFNDPPFNPEYMAEAILELIDTEVKKEIKKLKSKLEK